MSDQVTITTSESWFSRLKSSIGGVLFGVLLVIASFPVLWINEGRAVKTAKGLQEGAAAVVSVDSATVDPANEGRLVHVSGAVTATAPLADPLFGIRQQALQLVRKVEMYQWREKSQSTTKEKIGGGKETTTTYTYEKVWSDKLIHSSGFKEQTGHVNPAEMRDGQERWIAQDAKLGAFRFHSGLAERLPGAEPLLIQEGDYQYESTKPSTLRDGVLYLGANPDQPEVGDRRVRWEILRPTEASVVARQSGEGFAPYQAKSGTKIELVSKGIVSAESMFSSAVAANKALTWGLRAGGFLAMFLGIFLFFRPLAMIGHLIPVIGRLLDTGLALFAGVLAGILSLIVIAVSWLAYRPLLAAALLLAAVGLAVVALRMRRKKEIESSPVSA